MLREKKFFKYFWITIRFFGLQPNTLNTKEKFRAIFIFILLYLVNFVLFMVQVCTTDNAEERIKGIQTFPTYIIMLIDGINFVINSDKIEKMFNEMCGIINKSGETKLFSEAYNQTMKIAIYLAGFGVVSIPLGMLVFLITGKSAVPIYIPIDHGPAFIMIWALQFVFFLYSAAVFWFLDAFIFFTISMINANSLYMRKSFGKISLDNKADLVKCLRKHEEFRRWIENLF
jgi:hypothetical protein